MLEPLPRRVEPEQLDCLPASHPTAVTIHRDIRRYNAMLGNYRWFVRQLRSRLKPGDRILEVAAGTGSLCQYLLAKQVATPEQLTGFDAICPRPTTLPDAVNWQVCDALTFEHYAQHDIILVNHFLHQLTETELAQLGQQLSQARVLLACETLRRHYAWQLCQLSRLIGFSRAGIDDGLKSVHAGFIGSELPQLLALEPNSWTVSCYEGFPGWYRMVAIRN